MILTLDTFDRFPNQPLNAGALSVTRRTIRTLTCTVHDPHVHNPVQIANLYNDLHRLEDMFGAMQEQAA